MSSDSVHKISTAKQKIVKRLIRILLALLFILIFLLPLIGKGSTRFTNSSSPTDLLPQDEITRTRNDIPSHCTPTLDSFLASQLHAKQQQKQQSSVVSSTTTTTQKIILACHRKWCQSYGLCEPCSGIGDRTRHLLASVTEAMRRKLSIELDYPQVSNGVELRFNNALEYRDKWGSVAEFFHFRSYDVSTKEIHLDRWGGDNADGKGVAVGGGRGDVVLEDQFVHFIPLHGERFLHSTYDPCLYHVLFRPTPQLEKEITYYSNLFRLDTENVLGIHFRTGDSTAFGVANSDVRAAGSSLEQGYNRMLQCAAKLATKLNITPMIDTISSSSIEKLHFYLATDNQHVKDMAMKEEKYVIHLTSDKPSAYLRADGDRSAFLELYLLSKTKGLIINQIPKNYVGPAARGLSTFAQLAMNIGFMSDKNTLPCSLD